MRHKTSSNQVQTLAHHMLELPVRDQAYLRLSAEDLTQEFAWCEALIQARLSIYFQALNQSEKAGFTLEQGKSFNLPSPPILKAQNWGRSNQFNERSGHHRHQALSAYANFVLEFELSVEHRLALVLALASEIRPGLFDPLLMRNEVTGLTYFEFGVQLEQDKPYASGMTLAFILSGARLETHFDIQNWLQVIIEGESEGESQSLSPEQILSLKGLSQVLRLERGESNHLMSMPIGLTEEALYRFTTGRALRPETNQNFPAQYVFTDLDWQQLILPDTVMAQVLDIQHHILYGERLMQEWGLKGKIRPGYRALFYGPPGTGKTLTASLLGKVSGHDVYRIDLSLMVSKYIGETEKNLAKVFDLAEDKKWILLFDEADALFGKRNQAKSANDQFANQNVAYLLQRIETFNGIAILASNLKDNLDDAFFRRFESIIYFPVPAAQERLSLWQKSFSDKAKLEDKIDLTHLADKYPLSGASIMNVVRFASMQSIQRGYAGIQLEGDRQAPKTPDFEIHLGDLEQGIAKELEASGHSRLISNLKGNHVS